MTKNSAQEILACHTPLQDPLRIYRTTNARHIYLYKEIIRFSDKVEECLLDLRDVLGIHRVSSTEPKNILWTHRFFR